MTAILETAGSRSVVMPDGKKLSGKRFVAQAMWELATTGRVTMPDGVSWVVDPRDWIETVKWLYVHIDGPAKQVTELTGAEGGPLQIEYVIPHENSANQDTG